MSRTHRAPSLVLGFLIAVTTLAPSFAPLHAQQTPLTLLVLEHTEGGKKIKTPIPARAGASPSPLNGKTLDKIRILPGSTVDLAVPPLDVVVELYRGASFGGELVCTIKIRYFRNRDGGMVPHYQIDREPTVIRAPSGRWIPIEPECATPTSVTQSEITAADRSGFYATVEFGTVGGVLRIDSWVVR